MGFVEGVFGEVIHLVIDGLGRPLGHSVGHAAWDVPGFVAVEEGLPLLLDLLDLLLAHGPAHHVGLTQGVARQVLEDADDLLLVDDAAVGARQDGHQGGVLVGHLGRILGAGQEFGDGVHGAGAVQGDHRADVLNVLGLQAHTHTSHAGRLQLEHAGGLALGQHGHGGRVVLRNGIEGEARLPLLDHPGRVVQYGEVAQAQKVHLQQTQLLQGGHDVLGDGLAVVGGQGDVVHHRPAGDDHPGGVGGGVPGHPLDGHGGVDELFGVGVLVVGVLQLLGQPQGVLQGDVQRPRTAGDQLGQGVHLAVGHAQHPAHVPDGAPGGHGAEGDDLGHVVLAVLLFHIVDDLLPPAGAEVDVDIGHGHPLRVEEALEVQAVFHGVHVGDVQAVGHHGARRRAPAGPHRDAAPFGVADEVGDDEEVVHKAHLADHVHLIVQLF